MSSLNLRNSQYKKGSRYKPASDKSKFYNFRIHFLFFLILIVAGAIIIRLYILGVPSHAYYQELADNQHSIFKNLVPQRGKIYFKNGHNLYPVAVNKNTKMVYAVPKEVKNVDREAESLAKILSLDKKNLQNKLSKPNDVYEVVKHRLDENEIEAIDKAKLNGIHLANETYRYYPAQKLASQVLGFVGWQKNNLGGRYGIENYFNLKLKGQRGRLYQNRDNSGNWIFTGRKEITYAKNGSDVVLTIDPTIQYETEKILQSAVEKFEADRGTIIVVEPKTGKILAMANYPDFNPNQYRNVSNMENFVNSAVSDPYECGSVFKAITLSAAVDDNKVNPNTTYVDTGQVRESGYTIRNSDLKAHGTQTMTQVLEKSLNTGAIYAERLLGNKNFADYVKRFGFGKISGISLPAENPGNINNLKNLKSNIQFFTASFGQGITVTPIQLVLAYNAIANGGVLMKPQIVEKIIHTDGTEENIEPQEKRRVISQNAANQVAQMLRSVVTNGHGKRADVPGYLVAGKTGTAQVASTDKKGYAQGKSIGSFAGFAPTNNPQFTVLVRIDNPKGVQWAESSAAPTFGELMKFLLDYKNIKPTEKYTQADLNAFNRRHTLSDYFIKNDENNEQTKKNK